MQFPQQLPRGTEVTLTEAPLDGSARFTWAEPVFSGDRVSVTEGGSAVVTIGAADVAEVSLVNTAVASLGSLSITKSLAGDAAGRSSETVFPVTVTWIDLLGENQTRDVQLVAGEPVFVEDVPLGTEVRVEEKAATLANLVRWTGAQWGASDDSVTVTTESGSAAAVIYVDAEPGATAELSLRNTLVVDPGLPATGGDASGLWMGGGLAAGLLVAGGLLLLVRRRRQQS